MGKVFTLAAVIFASIFSCLVAESHQEDSFKDVFDKLRASKSQDAKQLDTSNISSPRELTTESILAPACTKSYLGGATEFDFNDPSLSLSELEKPEGLNRQSYVLNAPVAISLQDQQIQQPFQLEIEEHEKACFGQWPRKEGNVIVNHYKEKNWFESVEGELDYPQFSPLETMIHQHACWMKCDARLSLREMRVNGFTPPSPGVAAKHLQLNYDSSRSLTMTRAKQLIVFVVQSLFQTLMSKDAALHPALDPSFNLMSLEVTIENKSALVAYIDIDTFRRVYLSNGMVFFDPWEKERAGDGCHRICMKGIPYAQVLEEVRIACEAAAQ